MDKLQAIFDRQAQYLISLRPTYLHNGFLKHASQFPWNLDDRHYQEEFRLLAWRCTEEILEACETYRTIHPKNQGREFYNEEVSDALHFFIELCLVSGVTMQELITGVPLASWHSDTDDSLDWLFKRIKGNIQQGGFEYYGGDLWQETIRTLGLAMMKLRQRPWRVDHRPTDRREWVIGLHLTFEWFVAACTRTGISAGDLHNAYFKKAQTNDKRTEEFGA